MAMGWVRKVLVKLVLMLLLLLMLAVERGGEVLVGVGMSYPLLILK